MNAIEMLRDHFLHRQWAASCTPTDFGRQEEARMHDLLVRVDDVEALLEGDTK